MLPDLSLQSTDGVLVNFSRLKGLSVCFFYPYTGRPGVADPPGWDDIPGAHGSTAQALAFSRACNEFKNLGVRIFGVSLQHTDWQQEFVSRNNLAFPLLSDADGALSSALGVERFRAGEVEYLRRTTFIIDDGRIELRRDGVNPHHDAEECLALLKR